jgi:ferrous iron transport protein B
MQREVGARWAMLGVAWSTGLGYGAAVLFYQLATFSRHPGTSLLWAGIILAVFAAAVYGFHIAGRKTRRLRSPLQQRMA